ncbi:Cytochrome c-type biogenesis protein CcdA (DsbD analog) [Olavius algarvensis associated proteobacterium Delta 3]|nr:Cytochrome c-type biogenesis protein CcdA (DsbD analog) [Olavius algarvensis associated proteobacterium Delta 3]CAB5165663.1 Cytochrome c-type biogenesis protein CcdA (DsbD analog) [Olavius algarvensis associated proteobacterium Delta 3]
MFAEPVTYPAALLAGLLSFFSPCVLPLIPAYFTFITGYSLEELTGSETSRIRKKVVLSTLAFVMGFSFVFVLLGASASFLGGLFFQYRQYVRVIGGVIILVFGLHLMGLFRIRALDFEKRLQLRKKPLHMFGTFLVGMAFGAGWSPCVGPLLGSILIIAGSQETIWQGIGLLGVYSAGLAVPFLVISVFIHLILTLMQKASSAIRYINVAAGSLLILVGIGLILDRIQF